MMVSWRIHLLIGIVCVCFVGYRALKVAPNELILGYHANEDALSHLILTSNLIAGGHAERCLPVFTFPGASNRGINNLPGAGCFAQDGRLYYTSFPPGLFLPLAGLGWLTGWTWTPFSARSLLILLHLLTAALMAGLVREFIKPFQTTKVHRSAIPWLAFVLTLTNFEFARSFTFSFWGQHWLQLLLLILVWLFIKQKRGALFYVLVFVMPLIEWTGYVANAGLFLVLLLERRFVLIENQPISQFRLPSSAIRVVLLTCAAGVLQITAFGGLVGYHEYFAAVAGRQEMRGTDLLSLLKLPFATAISAGPMLLLPALLLWQVRTKFRLIPRAATQIWSSHPYTVLGLLLLFLPCLENLLLSNHALVYTFDRLKSCAFLVVVTCLLPFLTHSATTRNRRFFGLAACVCLLNLLMFIYYTGKIYQDRKQSGGNSISAAKWIANRIPASENVIVNENVRASFLYYAGRNVHVELNPINSPEEYLQRIPMDALPLHLVLPEMRRIDARQSSQTAIQSITF